MTYCTAKARFLHEVLMVSGEGPGTTPDKCSHADEALALIDKYLGRWGMDRQVLLDIVFARAREGVALNNALLSGGFGQAPDGPPVIAINGVPLIAPALSCELLRVLRDVPRPVILRPH